MYQYHCFHALQPHLTVILWVFTWQHVWNSSPTKGKPLIRWKPIIATISTSDNNKHWLSFISITPFHPYQISPHPLSRPTLPLHSSMIFPFTAAGARQKERRMEERNKRIEKKKKKRKGKHSIGPNHHSFPLLDYAALSCLQASPPWEAHLVHNLRPCNVVPGPKW